MNRRLATVSLSSFVLLGLLAGCQQKSADQQAADNSAAPASDSAKSTPREAPPKPRPIVVPAETVLAVTLDEPVGSKISTPGQRFAASMRQPVEVNGRVAIPKGARVTGQVKDAKPAGRFKGAATLELTLTSIEINGVDHEIHTTAPTQSSTGKGKRTAAMVGGGAGGGGLVGGRARGGKGAVSGGLIGAAGGTRGAGLTRQRDIKLPAGTPLTFKLVDPLEIRRKG